MQFLETNPLAAALSINSLPNVTRGKRPRSHDIVLMTPAAFGCLGEIDALVNEHQHHELDYRNSQKEVYTLGSVGSDFPDYNWHLSREDNFARMPLAKVWRDWFEQRPAELKDVDGLELVRAMHYLCLAHTYAATAEFAQADQARMRHFHRQFSDRPLLHPRFPQQCGQILHWLRILYDRVESWNFRVAAMETALAEITDQDVETDVWRQFDFYTYWLKQCLPQSFDFKDIPEMFRGQVWNGLIFAEQPGRKCKRKDIRWTISAYKFNLATADDVIAAILDSTTPERDVQLSLLVRDYLVQSNKPHSTESDNDLRVKLNGIVQKALSIAVDFFRDRDGIVLGFLKKLSAWQGGLKDLSRLLMVFQNRPFAVSEYGEPYGRHEVFTRLIGLTRPEQGDTKAGFDQLMDRWLSESRAPRGRILELVLIAPNWLDWGLSYLNWPGTTNALAWISAHAAGWRYWDRLAEHFGFVPDTRPEIGSGIRWLTAFEKLLAARSSRTKDQLSDGEIDLVWFHQTHSELGSRRFQKAIFTHRIVCPGIDGRKLKFMVSVLLGRINVEHVLDRVERMHSKDAVRMLALAPLPEELEARTHEIARRYRTLLRYRDYALSRHSFAKSDALMAFEIGFKHLVEVTGLQNRMQLVIAMEQFELREFEQGRFRTTAGNVTIVAQRNQRGFIAVSVEHPEQWPYAGIPAELKCDPNVASLLKRIAFLNNQSRRLAYWLESAMCQGDTFTGQELKTLVGNQTVGRCSRIYS